MGVSQQYRWQKKTIAAGGCSKCGVCRRCGEKPASLAMHRCKRTLLAGNVSRRLCHAHTRMRRTGETLKQARAAVVRITDECDK